MAQQGSPPRRSVQLSETDPGAPQGRGAGSRSAGSRSAGSRGAGSRGAGSRSAGSRSAGSRSAGSPATGSRSAGSPATGSRGAGRLRHSDRPGWQDPGGADDTGGDLPPWAGPDANPAAPGRRQDRLPGASPDLPAADAADADPGGQPGRSRVTAGRNRRSRQRVYAWVIGVVAVVFTVVSVLWLRSSPKPVPHVSYVNTLQHGEFSAAPDACRAVSAATLRRYLPAPGGPKTTQSIASPVQSQCSFTADAQPLFRVLEITDQAYQPSALAPGTGSATENATSIFFQDRAALANPPPKSHLPRAVVSPLVGLGQAAFSAVQVFHAGADTTDLVTITVRDRNTVITVTLQGLASRGGRYGPVSVADLQAGALAAAQQVAAHAAAQPVR